MKFIAGNAQNIGARPQQQDAFGFSDPGNSKFVAHAGFLGVVADGMGGLTHGSEASRSAVLAFLSAYKRKTVGESIPKALTRCLGEANLGVLRVAQNVPAGDEVGTTLVAAVLHDHALYWVSVGDSRIYLLRGNTLTQLTADHVFARDLNHQVAEGKISIREALNHPERSSLTSYLGQVEPAHVDKNARPLQVTVDDCVVLCSDGFYRALTEQELVTGLHDNPQTACDTLVGQALAKHRKQQDNLTVITLKRHTGTQLSRKIKHAIAAAAIVLITLSGGAGYWIGKHLAATSSSTLKPSPKVSDQTPSPKQPEQQGSGTGTVQQNTAPADNSQTATKNNQNSPKVDKKKKKDHVKTSTDDGETPPAQPVQAPKARGTTQGGGGQSSQQPPSSTPDAGKPQDKPVSPQTGLQDQQKSDQQKPDLQAKPDTGHAPATPNGPPTSGTSPQPNTDNQKGNSEPSNNKDDQPKPPSAQPKDIQQNPQPQPEPNTSWVAVPTQKEG